MNRTDLAYFCLVADAGSFTRAAQKLYISQQALSSRIAKLESQYSTALFERGKTLRLTDTGKVLYDSAVQILGTLDRCDKMIQDITDSTNGFLSVGIPVTRGTVMLPKLCMAFRRMYPCIRMTIFEGDTTAMVEEQLMAGKLDLSIGYIPADTTNVISHVLYEERYYLIISQELLSNEFPTQQIHKILCVPQPLSVFSHIPFVVQAQSTKSGQNFKKMCHEAGFTPKVALETSNILTALNLCIAGMGASVFPSIFLRECIGLTEIMQTSETVGRKRENEMVIIRLKTDIGIAPVVVNRLRTRALTKAGKDFISIAQSIFSK